MKEKPELLSPAGSAEALQAAIQHGCDAVYIGGQKFSARASADNFTDEQLKWACEYCHVRGKKCYIALNTLCKGSEWRDAIAYASFLYEIGADALILQDVGLANKIHKEYPDLPLHASTQLSASSLEDVSFLQNMGFCRTILSRELSLDEISQIAAGTSMELEVFVHGAYCVSYSGQCLLSSMIGGRSGNRGRCAQPCRLPYTLKQQEEELAKGYLLSPKDLQAISILPELEKIGIASIKIEGRMKHPNYVAGVTQIYRDHLDHLSPLSSQEKKVLLQLFNRGGFTDGYFSSQGGQEMMSAERVRPQGVLSGRIDRYDKKRGVAFIRTREPFIPGDGIEVWTAKEPHCGTYISKASKAGEVISLSIQGEIQENDPVYKTYDKALNDSLENSGKKDTVKTKIQAAVVCQAGNPFLLRLWGEDCGAITQSGPIVEHAQNRPITEEDLKKQLQKMGATPFQLEMLEIDLSPDAYLSIKDLNQVRRLAADALEKQMLENSRRVSHEISFTPMNRQEVPPVMQLTAMVSNLDQLHGVLEADVVSSIYCEITPEMLQGIDAELQHCKEKNISVFGVLPRVSRPSSQLDWQKLWQKAAAMPWDGFVLRKPGQFLMVKDRPCIADYTLNIWNNESSIFWEEQGAMRVCLSPELSFIELKSLARKNAEIILYGRLPLMTTHQCPIGNFAGGRQTGKYCEKRFDKLHYHLEDRKGALLHLQPDCFTCTCLLLSDAPIDAAAAISTILNIPAGFGRLQFSIESKEETVQICKAYHSALQHADPFEKGYLGRYCNGVE